jgi:hypothetical protein
MSYVPWECRDEVTWQQGGRMQCWTNYVLSTWLAVVAIESDTSEGPAPLQISFNGVTEKTVLDWSWDFGDGDGADEQSPVHTFQEPGLYDISVTIETTEGFFIRNARELIWAQGDTLMIPTIAEIKNLSTRFDVYAHNSLPLQKLWIPFSWAGSLDLQFDSTSTAGLRTELVSIQGLVNFSPSNRRATFRLATSGTEEIPVDTGAVLSIWLTCQSGTAGQSSPVALISYSSFEPKYVARRAEFVPTLIDGAFVVCLPGDINGSGSSTVDIADLVYLVDYMFNDGPEPPVMATADVDGSGGIINIADLVYLVDYMFNGGPAPVCLS